MELSWGTFVLEIINFLVLVWILKRFLYKPVLEVIDRRQRAIERSLAEATAARQQAESLQRQYENRLVEWDREKEQARAALRAELEAERKRRLAQLEQALEQERQKAQVLMQRRLDEARRQAEEQALEQAARFGSRLLAQAAGPETEARLAELAIEALAALPRDRRQELKNAYAKAGGLQVASAYPLDGELRGKLEQALARTLGQSVSIRYEQEPELMAGLRLAVGPWRLGANLRDELEAFVESAHAPD